MQPTAKAVGASGKWPSPFGAKQFSPALQRWVGPSRWPSPERGDRTVLTQTQQCREAKVEEAASASADETSFVTASNQRAFGRLRKRK